MIGSRSKSKLSTREYPQRMSGCQAGRGRSVKSKEKLSRFPRRGEFPRGKLNSERGRGARRFRGGICEEPRIFNSQ